MLNVLQKRSNRIFSRASRTLRGATQVVTFMSVTKNVSEAQSPYRCDKQ